MPKINETLLPYLKQYGKHSMAYTSLEPEMEYFVVDGMGYIAYISFKHWFWAWSERKIVLADPLCDTQNYREIIKLFLKKYPDVIFVQSSKQMAEALHQGNYNQDGISQKGLQINQFGIETEIPIQGFSLKGKHRAKLRQWQNKCKREGVLIKEQPINECKNIDEIKTLSQQWLSKKSSGEFGFLVRPLRFGGEPDVRYFWAYQADKLIALATFDPMYSDGKVVGYYHNIDRLDACAPHGTSASIILEAINVFEKEGKQFVSLGMSPLYLYGGARQEINHHKFTRKAFFYAYEKLNFIYPFKGNYSHKSKFNGDKKFVYISSTKGTGLWQVFVMMKAIKMI
ncbi:MAG: DUF2156 domain-containing protein [Cocleimonas sp.]